jgi:hypothetical protein
VGVEHFAPDHCHSRSCSDTATRCGLVRNLRLESCTEYTHILLQRFKHQSIKVHTFHQSILLVSGGVEGTSEGAGKPEYRAEYLGCKRWYQPKSNPFHSMTLPSHTVSKAVKRGDLPAAPALSFCVLAYELFIALRRILSARPTMPITDFAYLPTISPYKFRAMSTLEAPVVYRPLRPGCIRLLELWPGRDDDLLSCRIRTYPRSSSPPYEALSYMWGPQDFFYDLYCGERPTRVLKISGNLRDALLRLRPKPDASAPNSPAIWPAGPVWRTPRPDVVESKP